NAPSELWRSTPFSREIKQEAHGQRDQQVRTCKWGSPVLRARTPPEGVSPLDHPESPRRWHHVVGSAALSEEDHWLTVATPGSVPFSPVHARLLAPMVLRIVVLAFFAGLVVVGMVGSSGPRATWQRSSAAPRCAIAHPALLACRSTSSCTRFLAVATR